MDDRALTVRMDGDEISLPLREIRRVQKEGDGLANGAIIGALIFGIRWAMICGQGMDDPERVPLAVAATTTLGALVGAVFDEGHVGRTTIYPAARRRAARWDPAPAVAFTVRC